MNWIRGIFYFVLAACVVLLTLDVHRLMPRAAAALASVTMIEKSTSDLEEATYASEGEISNLADTMNGIASKLGDREDAELEQARSSALKFDKLLGDADGVVLHLDASTAQLGMIGATTNDAIRGIAADAHASLLNVNETLGAATADLADPSLEAGLEQIGPAVGNLAVATKEAAGATADIHRVTTYEAKQIMAPISKIKAVALTAATLVGKFFGF